MFLIFLIYFIYKIKRREVLYILDSIYNNLKIKRSLIIFSVFTFLFCGLTFSRPKKADAVVTETAVTVGFYVAITFFLTAIYGSAYFADNPGALDSFANVCAQKMNDTEKWAVQQAYVLAEKSETAGKYICHFAKSSYDKITQIIHDFIYGDISPEEVKITNKIANSIIEKNKISEEEANDKNFFDDDDGYNAVYPTFQFDGQYVKGVTTIDAQYCNPKLRKIKLDGITYYLGLISSSTGAYKLCFNPKPKDVTLTKYLDSYVKTYVSNGICFVNCIYTNGRQGVLVAGNNGTEWTILGDVQASYSAFISTIYGQKDPDGNPVTYYGNPTVPANKPVAKEAPNDIYNGQDVVNVSIPQDSAPSNAGAFDLAVPSPTGDLHGIPVAPPYWSNPSIPSTVDYVIDYTNTTTKDDSTTGDGTIAGDSLLDIVKNAIISALKYLFVPDAVLLDTYFTNTLQVMQDKFGIDLTVIENLQSIENGEFTCTLEEYTIIPGILVVDIGEIKCKAFRYYIQYKNTFYAIITGFMGILLVLYNWRMLVLVFGQNGIQNGTQKGGGGKNNN